MNAEKRLLRLGEVMKRVPLKRSAIYQLAKQGSFPKPVNMGSRSVAWVESEIDAWIDARIATARGAVA